ncbi:MAG: sensor histidine kinase, partial [Luteibaculum sp.]
EKDTTQRSIILTNPILSDEKECVGLINCIIRLPDLANTAYSRLNNPKDLSFSIHDKDQGKRIFFSDGAFEEKKAGFVVSKSLPVLGRLWNIEVMRPKYGLPWNAILILGFGFLVFSLSSILVYRLLNDKSKILLETNLALEINSKQLLEKNKELEQFIHISSHDLREPVNTLGSFLELLEEENQDKLDSDSKTYLHYAKNQQQRMESIVRSLGDYIRIGRAQEKTLTDMQSLVEAAIAKNQKVIKAIDAKIQVNSLPSLAIFRHEMESVWNNLISNALKFHKNNSHCFIEIGHQDLPGEHLFFIKDNGIGIEPQYYDRIFEIFKRLNLRDEFSGNGMGLSICRKAIEHHGGKIWVESESGKGAAFFFKLPKA